MASSITMNNPSQGADVAPPVVGPAVSVSGSGTGMATAGWAVQLDCEQGTLPVFHLVSPAVNRQTDGTFTYTATANVPYGQYGQVWANLYDAAGVLRATSANRDVDERATPPS